MSDLLDLIKDTFPANNDVGVPLKSDITITLSGLDYDEDSLKEGLFVEGPDTDQFIGPGLIDQFFPDNNSQGDLDDFLQSPGYKGIVKGVTTVSGVAGATVVTFNPTLPLFPLTPYVVNLTEITQGTEPFTKIEGFVTFNFVTGTGSIETVPDTVSSSVLSVALPESSVSSTEALKILTTTPLDRSVQHPNGLREITIEFNKDLNVASVASADIIAKTTPTTDHPNANVKSVGNLAKSVVATGKKIIITI